MATSGKKWTPPRVAARYLMDQRLTVRAGTTLHGRTKDISEDGLGATIAGDLAMHESVELEFYLPGSLVLQKIKAQVRYRRGFQYGFRFLNPTNEQQALIRGVSLQLQLVST